MPYDDLEKKPIQSIEWEFTRLRGSAVLHCFDMLTQNVPAGELQLLEGLVGEK